MSVEGEIKQMLDKRVWHGVPERSLTDEQRRLIIRSTCFLKIKVRKATSKTVRSTMTCLHRPLGGLSRFSPSQRSRLQRDTR